MLIPPTAVESERLKHSTVYAVYSTYLDTPPYWWTLSTNSKRHNYLRKIISQFLKTLRMTTKQNRSNEMKTWMSHEIFQFDWTWHFLLILPFKVPTLIQRPSSTSTTTPRHKKSFFDNFVSIYRICECSAVGAWLHCARTMACTGFTIIFPSRITSRIAACRIDFVKPSARLSALRTRQMSDTTIVRNCSRDAAMSSISRVY